MLKPNTDISPQMPLKLSDEWHYFLSAVMFYTRLPTPSNAPHSKKILNHSRTYFPLIGIIIGLIGALIFGVSHLVFEHSLAVALSMVATILATGAFHEDGLADSCDGLGGGWTSEQVLLIMKDSRIGTYGTIALLSVLAIKFLSLVTLSQQPLLVFMGIYLVGHTTSRLFSSITIERYAYVQNIDSSKVKPITDHGLSKRRLITSTLIGLSPVLLLATLKFAATLLATMTAAIVSISFETYCKRRIGGYTGDILGAIQQLSEVSFYLGFVVVLSITR